MPFPLRSFRDLLRSLAAFTLAAALPVVARAEPVFGPSVYTKTASGGSDLYTDPFVTASAGRYVLWVQNGDDDGNRVSSGSISLNGSTIAGDADFAHPREYFAKAVRLLAGGNSLSVTLDGEPGSFLTVVIVGPRERPFFTVGRLLLPHGSASPGLQLELKNGSHGGTRSVRVHFYDAAGALVGASSRLLLEPRASLSEAVSGLIQNGSWTEGSIEVFYAGYGRGRVFGQVATTNAATGLAGLLPLQHAGARVRDPWRQLND
jgi:hypothetical protein